MNRQHSVQKKSKIFQKYSSHQTSYNPQSLTSIINGALPLSKQNRQLQNNMISTNRYANKQSLQNRYVILKQMYKNLIEKCKQKIPEETNQYVELEKLKNLHQKNLNEIKKLRSMLGFLDKCDQLTQTDNNLQLCDYESQFKNIPINTHKIDNHLYNHSTISSINNPTLPSSPTTNFLKAQPHRSQSRKPQKITDPTLYNSSTWLKKQNKNTTIQNIKSESSLIEKKIQKNQRNHSPNGFKDKYKFVPSLNIC